MHLGQHDRSFARSEFQRGVCAEGLGWWDISDRPEQACVVEQIDLAEGGNFQILHVVPRSLAVDQLGFIEAVYRLDH